MQMPIASTCGCAGEQSTDAEVTCSHSDASRGPPWKPWQEPGRWPPASAPPTRGEHDWKQDQACCAAMTNTRRIASNWGWGDRKVIATVE
jgi:hypothetical protein